MQPPPLPTATNTKKDDNSYDVAPPVVLPDEPAKAGKKGRAQTDPSGKQKPQTDRKYPCVECGARMEYNPQAKAMKCPYCGHTDKVPEKTDGKVVERDYEVYLKKLEKKQTGSIGDDAVQVKCSGCGATVTFDKKITADQCPYCHTHLDKHPEKADEVIIPESVLPFGISNREAVQKFQEWVRSRWFAPNALKELANLGKLQGIYLPYFTYDAMTHTYYSGRRGDRYVSTYTDSDGKQRTTTRIDWTFTSGEIEHFFDDVLVCASKRLPNDLVKELTPWDLENLVPFSADFMSGFQSERYTIEMPDGFQIARNFMENHLVFLCKRDIGGDMQEIISRQSEYMGISFKHLLLPVWMTNYRYFEKTYPVVVNGRTGEVQGYRPYSVWKIIRLVVIILAVVGLLIYLTRGKKGSSSAPRPTNPPMNMNFKVGQARPTHLRMDHSMVNNARIAANSQRESVRLQV